MNYVTVVNYLLDGLLKWPSRKRHACGFGLHSPYAFAMVTGVLRDSTYGYYAYQSLGETARRWHRSEREARSLYRLLIHLRSFLGDDFHAQNFAPVPDNFLLEIARLALPAEAFKSPGKSSKLVLIDRCESSCNDVANALKQALRTPPSACLISGINHTRQGKALRKLLLDDHAGSMVFEGWHSMLLVSREGLPAQCFPVLFPR